MCIRDRRPEAALEGRVVLGGRPGLRRRRRAGWRRRRRRWPARRRRRRDRRRTFRWRWWCRWPAGGWWWPGRCRHRRGGVGVAFVCRRHGVVALRAAQPRPHASMAGGVAFPDGSVSVYASPALQQPRLWYDSRPRTKAELASVLKAASSISLIPLSTRPHAKSRQPELTGVVTALSQRSRT